MAVAARNLRRSRHMKTGPQLRHKFGKIGPSGFLFAQPSFLGGVASVIDLGGTLVEYNESLSPEQADALALWADWWAIGDDFRDVIAEEAEGLDPTRKLGAA